MSNFWTRTITGTLFVIVMVGCTWWNQWSFAALYALIIALSQWEFFTLLEKNGQQPQKITGMLIGLAFFAVGFVGGFTIGAIGPIIYMGLLMPVLGIIFFLELFRKKENPLANVGHTVLGIVYISFPFTFFNCIVFRFDQEHWINFIYTPYLLLGYFFLVWSNDTFAYLVGRAIGRTKFFERISPKKTWEGTVGGALCTQGVAWLISLYFTDVPTLHWMIIGGIVSVTGTLGDLAESMFKRSIHIKDSGHILPGHGGMLDRFDGVLLSAPFVCLYFLLIK